MEQVVHVVLAHGTAEAKRIRSVWTISLDRFPAPGCLPGAAVPLGKPGGGKRRWHCADGRSVGQAVRLMA
jgi:hypothetical protein